MLKLLRKHELVRTNSQENLLDVVWGGLHSNWLVTSRTQKVFDQTNGRSFLLGLVDNLSPNYNYPDTSGLEDPVAVEHESVDIGWRGPFNLRTLNTFVSTSSPLPTELKLEQYIYRCPWCFGGTHTIQSPREECLQSWASGLIHRLIQSKAQL